MVVAAGNDNADSSTYHPASSPYVITVGGYTRDHSKSTTSNYGSCIDAWAPGTGILSSYYTDGAYQWSSGTSLASPIMAGIVGHLLMLNPDDSTTTLDTIKSTISAEAHSFNVTKSKSAKHRAFSMSCVPQYECRTATIDGNYPCDNCVDPLIDWDIKTPFWAWWMDDIMGHQGDNSNIDIASMDYTYPIFDSTNLIVYVVDSEVNFKDVTKNSDVLEFSI